jgi:magnesium chelatase subunit D
MNTDTPAGAVSLAAADAALAAALFAVDPQGLGGVLLRTPAGPARDGWLALLRRLLPPATPWRRIPLHINDTALLGGLDLSATLQAGRPVARQGLLAQADGGVVLLAMAERIEAGLAARLAAVLDTQAVRLERDGVARLEPARLGIVALDEGIEDDERPSAALADRLALRPTLAAGAEDGEAVDWQAADIVAARGLLAQVSASDAVLQALCAAADALGVDSLRGPLLALRAARAAAALAGDSEVQAEHAALAARLVLAPRATRLPPSPAPQDGAEPPEPDPQQDASPPGPATPENPGDPGENPREDSPGDPPDEHPDDDPSRADELQGQVLHSARAAIPAGLLAALQAEQLQRGRAQAGGRAGAPQKSHTRGRPVGVRRGPPQGGARINVIETLRAAAPWQRLRGQQAQALAQARGSAAGPPVRPRRVHVRPEDFHVTRFRQLGQTTTVFVVDASGSSALHRLAEAKGAVELLLADCYVRRDRVSVLAFRGAAAELLLPPTRSLARAKRSLAGLPGGGGTPLASALDAAGALAGQIRRRGETPVVVLLTDGRANIARDGTPGRGRAAADALDAARQLRQAGLTALLLDTSPQPQASARLLAREMGALYVPLPHAGAQAVSQVVRAATAAP